MYDSTKDADIHIKNIQRVYGDKVKPYIDKRFENHDRSKYSEPELSTYNTFIPKLREAKYGSPEYNAIRDKMFEQGLKHHFQVNRHHPEHFDGDFNRMNLIDLLEMVCDWYAASLKSDTGFEEGLQINADKFNMSPLLVNILMNTYKDVIK